MTIHSPIRTLATLAVVGLAACGGAEESGMEEADAATPEVETTAVATETPMEMPDTTAEAVWAYIQENDYTGWTHFPGTGDQYQGQQPHGALLTTYVNDEALGALESGGENISIPEDGIIIKENFSPQGQLAAVTVMYKVPGYNAEHNDWWWAKYLPDGSLDTAPNGMELEGRLPGCQGCHIQAQSDDYVVTDLPEMQ